jgi:hypothetical protein
MKTQSKYFLAALASVGVMAGATLLVLVDDGDAPWRITPSASVNSVHFRVRHSTVRGDWIHSRDVSLDHFRGFSLSMLASPGPAKFEYVGDAGRLKCEGRFLLGAGSGSYTFAADPAFVAVLRQMGYDTPDDEQLLSMLVMDVNREFARDIRDAGLRATTRELVQLRIHGIDQNYIRETRHANFSADDYVQLRIHGVSAEYLKGLKEAGYGNLRVDEINQLRNHGVEPEFPREARRLGYDFTPEELAQLRTHGVDSHYLRHLQDTGMRNLTADQIAQLRIHGVD